MKFRGIALTTIRRRVFKVVMPPVEALVWAPGMSQEADALWQADTEQRVRERFAFDLIWRREEVDKRLEKE